MKPPAIDQDRLWSHLKPFSTTVRDSGSEEELAAFQYAENVLKEAGFAVKLLHNPGYVSHPRAASLRVGPDELSCITHAMALNCPEGRSGLAVSEEAENLSGKIALIAGMATPAA